MHLKNVTVKVPRTVSVAFFQLNAKVKGELRLIDGLDTSCRIEKT